MKIFIQTRVNSTIADIIPKFNRDLFIKLAPPLMKLKVTRFDGCEKGNQVHLEMNIFGMLNQKWISLITASEKNSEQFYFIDEGTKLPSPLVYWKHIHRVDRIDDLHCFVTDDIEFKTASPILDTMIYSPLYLMFYFRKKIYQKELSNN